MAQPQALLRADPDPAAGVPPPAKAAVETTVLGSRDGAFSDGLLALALDAITGNAAFKARATADFTAQGLRFSSYPALLAALQKITLALVRLPEADLDCDPFAVIEELNLFKARVNVNIDTYDTKAKPNPAAVFWPNPQRDPAQSLYRTLPFVAKQPLVTKQTPVGSAGSCFAFEFARNLQRRGFNYVVTESEAEDMAAGVLVDGFDAGNPYARFSANFGLLFNTPSFRQLAEKAFGVRRPARVVLPTHVNTTGGGKLPVLVDPFRENVYFRSREAYEANYEKHLAAVRAMFLKSEVFVATPGLNECWEFVPDGSVLSRNPRELDIMPFLRHRVLTVAENVANLQQLIDVVRVHNPTFKLIISLSPIPFLATGRASDCHVVTANSHSKAVLRVAIEEVVKANRDVYYFPSYELVTACSENPWTPDQRHVSEATVERVMALFDAMFVQSEAVPRPVF